MGLGARLLAAQLLVVLSGSLTLGVVAVLVAPAIFTRHLDMVRETDPMVRGHAQQAFDSAFGLALGVGTAVAIVAATIVSAFVVRRISGPVTQLARAADALADADYSTPVPQAGLGPEFDRLTAAFTGMAARLARTEEIRRGLMADLAHEMRTPVATIQAHVEGLEDGVVSATPATWQVLRDQSDRLARLATDMAQLSAAEEHALPLDRHVADLRAIAAAAVDAAAPAYRAKDVDLGLTAGSPVTGAVDAIRIQQVMANLLANAVRHTAPGGAVAVSVRADGPDAVITVRDNGAGVPGAELDAIFERFHRVDHARSRTGGGGSGLGLTIARAIITRHGGTLHATSDGPGTGAAFTARLPRAPETARDRGCTARLHVDPDPGTPGSLASPGRDP